MKIEGLLICQEDRIVVDQIVLKAKLFSIGIAGHRSIKEIFEKYYSKKEVEKFMAYNRHNRKANPSIISMYEKVLSAESKLLK